MHIFLSDLAQSLGLILFVVAFVLVLIYALSPSNGALFERAAHMALEEEGTQDD